MFLPHKTYKATLKVIVWDLEVPYTMDAVLVFTDGTRVSRTIGGTYKGSNSVEGSVQWDDITPGHPKNALADVSFTRS